MSDDEEYEDELPVAVVELPVPGPGPRLDALALHAALEARRIELGISKRTMSRSIMLSSPSILTRLGKGLNVSADVLVRILLFLGDTDLRPYIDLDHFADQVDPEMRAQVAHARHEDE